MSKNKKRKMIRKGKEESIIERLEEYIIPVYPEWKERRVPASEEKIAEWNKKCGKLLPEAYLQYLKYMGEGDGEFLSRALLAETELSEIMELYERFLHKAPGMLAVGGIMAIYTTEEGILQRCLKKCDFIKLLKRWTVREKEGSVLYVLQLENER